VINLKRAGRWKNMESAKEYIDHYRPVQKDRMARLGNGKQIGNQQVSRQCQTTGTILTLVLPC
jgi:hypothetical protein